MKWLLRLALGFLAQDDPAGEHPIELDRPLGDRDITDDAEHPLAVGRNDPRLEVSGLIDLQVNGAFGAEVGDRPEDLRHLAARLPATGVTAFLPAVVTSTAAGYRGVYAAFHAARSAPGAQALGLHLEGPYLSPQHCGAHQRSLVEAARSELMSELLEGDALRLMTLAPEHPDALRHIRQRSHGRQRTVGVVAIVIKRRDIDAGQVAGGGGISITQSAGGALAVNVAPSEAVSRYRLNLSVNMQNLFNRPTYGGYSGVLTSPSFLQPTSASGVRRTTMNMNLTF